MDRRKIVVIQGILNGEIVAHPVKLLFKEQKGNWYVSRFLTELPVDELSKVFETSNWYVLNYQNGQVNRYEAGSKTQKALQQVQAQTFSLYDNSQRFTLA